MATEPSGLAKAPAGDPWFPVARLLRPQGRRGELLCEPLTDRLAVFFPGTHLRLSPGRPPESAGPTTVVLEAMWQPQGRNAGRLVLKLEGVDSITEAEALYEHVLLVEESALPPLEADAFLVRDLLGCELFDGERPVGTVVEVQFPVGPDGRTRLPDAPDLLAVSLPGDPGSEPVLVPFVKAWLTGVDLERKQLHMQLPPGLFDQLQQPEPDAGLA